MKSHGILVNFSGFFRMLNSFFPDNGLAILAGALLRAGERVFIEDYCTLQTWEKFRSASMIEYCHELQKIDSCHKVTPLHQREILQKCMEKELNNQLREIEHDIVCEIIRKVQLYSLHYVGFKVWINPGFGSVLRIATALRKQCPSLKLYAGGPHVAIYQHALRKEKLPFDAVVIADGEQAIIELAEYSTGKNSARRMEKLGWHKYGDTFFSRQDYMEMAELPFPCYSNDVYSSMRGDQKIKIIVMDESRGCSNQCHFCIHPRKSGPLRSCQQENIIKNFNRLQKLSSLSSFRFAGSSPPVHIFETMKSINSLTNQEITYSMFLDAKSHFSKQMNIAALSGCRAVSIGMECGSDSLRKKIFGKNGKSEDLSELVQNLKKQGIFVTLFVIHPVPTTVFADADETLETILAIKPDAVIITLPLIEPDTMWSKEPEKYGFRLNNNFYDETSMMNRAMPLYQKQKAFDDVPYKIGTLSMREAMGCADKLGRTLLSKGISVGISDDQALMAYLSGFSGRENEFNETANRALYYMEIDKIRSLVANINTRVLHSPHNAKRS